MARCDFCGKKAQAGNLVSHSGIKTKRLFKPNLHIKWVSQGGRWVRRKLCTKCLSKMRQNVSKESKVESPALGH